MRRGRFLAASTAVAFAATGLAAAAAGAAPMSGESTTVASDTTTNYVVLTDRAADAGSVAAQLKSAGDTVT